MTITTINELLIVFGQSFHRTFFFSSKLMSFTWSYLRTGKWRNARKKSLQKTFTSWTPGKTTCSTLKNNNVDNKDRCITQAKRTNQFQCLNEVWNSFGLSNSSSCSCCAAIQLNNERSIDRIFNFYSFFLSRFSRYVPSNMPASEKFHIISNFEYIKWKWNFVNCDSLKEEKKTHLMSGGGVCLMMYAYIQKE